MAFGSVKDPSIPKTKKITNQIRTTFIATAPTPKASLHDISRNLFFHFPSHRVNSMELTGCSYLDIARSIAFLDITRRCSASHCSPIAACAPMVTHMMYPSWLTDTSLPSPWTALPFVPTAPPTGSHIGFSAGELSTQIPL